MKIVETIDEFNEFNDIIKDTSSIVIPILKSRSAHSILNSLCALLFYTLEESYFLTFNHSEAEKLPIELLDKISCRFIYTPSKKVLMHIWPDIKADIYDLKWLELLATEQVIEESKFYTTTMRQLHNLDNYATPISHLIKYAMDYAKYLDPFRFKNLGPLKESFQFHNDVLIPACQFMEAGGVHVDVGKFKQYYGEKAVQNVVNSLVYTEYNPYTITGRVANKHGGISYSAIEKKLGTREAFTTRFDRGALVLIDFESFHLRLIAELIGFNLPKEPVHTYLAKQYFQTDSVTSEQYEEGKKLTFRYLYSDKQEGSDYLFFSKVYEFIEQTWENCQATQEYVFKSGHIINLSRMDTPSPSKLFNYILQWSETEVAMIAIDRLRPLFKTAQSKVTLFTYDSILIDFSFDDGKGFLKEVISILSYNGKYPVRVFVGANYQDLVKLTIL